MAKVGIIGGSGLYEFEGLEKGEEYSLLTPFGQPSGNYQQGVFEGVEVVFLARHGVGHKINPTQINYRANIFGMKKLGVDAIISFSACGSLKEDVQPMDFVLPDQFLDLTRGARKSTFYEDGLVVHVPFADPVDPDLRRCLAESLQSLNLRFHDGGTYVNMEGPQFSTKAESNVYRRWGMDVIGMTNATEAKLAREAEIAYVTLAAVTDYDCWHESHESVTVEMILNYLKTNVENAKKVLQKAIPLVGARTSFQVKGALAHAIVTAPDHIPENKKRELDILIGPYLTG